MQLYENTKEDMCRHDFGIMTYCRAVSMPTTIAHAPDSQHLDKLTLRK